MPTIPSSNLFIWEVTAQKVWEPLLYNSGFKSVEQGHTVGFPGGPQLNQINQFNPIILWLFKIG